MATTEPIFRLTILGEPKAVQSVKFARIGRFVRKYQPKGVADWKGYIKLCAIQELPEDWELLDCPVKVVTQFFFSPPKSFNKKKMQAIQEGKIIWKDTKPDLSDNLRKGLMDALTGVVWKDDSIICEDAGRKLYSMQPRIELKIYKLEDI